MVVVVVVAMVVVVVVEALDVAVVKVVVTLIPEVGAVTALSFAEYYKNYLINLSSELFYSFINELFELYTQKVTQELQFG